MSATAFIRLLESRGLLDPEIIAELNRQVETSKVRVTPEAIAKLLVENGQLTKFQATKLIAELNASIDRPSKDPTTALRGGRPIDPPLPPAPPKDHDSVEDLLPLEYTQKPAEVPKVEPAKKVEVVAEAPAPTVSPPTPVETPRASREFDYDYLPRTVERDIPKKKNAWESFRVLGIGVLLLLGLVFLVPLVLWFLQGSAKEAFDEAKRVYEAREYERSSKLFADFAYNFSRDDRASEAKVYSVLSRIREDVEKVADPNTALKKAQELLPTIASEEALGGLRTDVTDMLLQLSEKYIKRVDATPALDDREKLLEKMSEQMNLVRDPRYVGSQERTQNALRIQNIEEGQARAKRDIQRGKDLLVAIDVMSKANEAKDVNETYNTRRDIIRKYPILESDLKLNELLNIATGLQKDLVVSASKMPSVGTESVPAGISAKAMLVNRTAKSDSESPEVIFLKLKGYLVAIRAGNGAVLWSQFFGLDWTGKPQPLALTGDSDVIVSYPEKGVLKRLAAADGSLVWEVKLEHRIHEPMIDGDDIFVTAENGEIYSLDAATGVARWGKKIPQNIEVGVGGALGRKKRYAIGNHSNLYALSRTSGQCEEVEYLGHNPGTISIPPIWVLNHLIVFENAGPDYSFMKILNTNDDGLGITPSAQIPFRFKGHFVVEPQIEGRRFVVTTNLGEVAMFEVDVASTKDKVVKLAGNIEKETDPKITWPLLLGTDLYLASNRLAKYEVQVSSQKMNRSWLKDDGDTFTNRPVRVNEAIIHSRIVRGTLGVRVASINPQTGDPNWETDLGVPISWISGTPNRFTALTTQGAVFSFDTANLQSQKPVSQIENLGRNQRLMKFLDPLSLQDGRIAIFNSAQGNQLLIIDPSKNSNLSKLLSIEFKGAIPANDAIAVGNTIIVPLSNAQLAMIDPDKAQQVGIPFQPTIEAGENPKWLNPVLLEDQQSIVIADQKRSIYKLSTNRQLRPIVQQTLDAPLKGRLSVLGNTIVAVSNGETGDQLEFFDGIELKKVASLPVQGRFAWGPYVVSSPSSKLVIALSDIEGLIAANANGKRVWSSPLDRQVLSGKPVIVDEDILVGTTTGNLLRFSKESGKRLSEANIGEPINGTPLILGNELLLPTDGGSVITVPIPRER